MKHWMIVAAALCIGPAAAAQDPAPAVPPKEEPAAKHENRVSAAAKAVLDKWAALVYSPLKGGLKDLSGAVKMEAEASGVGDLPRGPMGAMGKLSLVFAVSFKAPSDLKVELKDAPGLEDADADGEGMGMGSRMRKRITDGMNLRATRLLRTAIEGFVPAGDSEYDADVRVENGVTTLLVTTYLKGVEVSREEFTLDANGLPSLLITTPRVAPPAPQGGRGRGSLPADGRNTLKFAYAREGDLFRLDRMTMDGIAGPMESKITWADAGTFKVVRSWEMTPPDAPVKFAFRFSELIVNGKPLALPAEGKAPEPKSEEPKPAPVPKPGEEKGEK